MLLLPHLRRAVTISNVLDARLIEHTRLAQALDALRCGVVMTNGEGAILHANQAAEEMLRDGTAVQGRGGILNAADAAAAQELRQAIRLAAGDESTLGETGLAVSLGAPGGAPLFAHVLPMTGGNLRTRLQPEAAAAVIIGTATPDLTREERKDHLRRRYGLTPAEADVALEIARGEGRDACAARLGISTATVRAHLGRIFEKTGVHRQAELTHLLLTGTRETPPAEWQAGKRRRSQ
jgi:DNA-binding CsgD family transcriptional regulator